MTEPTKPRAKRVKNPVGEYVRQLMKSRNLSYQQVADRAGEDVDYIRGVVAGRTALLDPDRRRALAKALRVTSLDLLIAARVLDDVDLEEAERAGQVRAAPLGTAEELAATLRRIRLTDERVFLIRRYLQNWIDVDEREASPPEGGPPAA